MAEERVSLDEAKRIVEGKKKKKPRRPATPEEKQRRKERTERRKRQKELEAFEAAVETLPDSATVAKELNWIRNHPAMGRKYRMERNKQLGPVVINVDDVLNVSHGPAPSKAAVLSLQHWANHPAEFHKSLISEQKKSTKTNPDGSIGDDSEDLPEIKDIDQLIAGLDCAVADEDLSEPVSLEDMQAALKQASDALPD